ncbi:MAG: DUF2269 family protein [Acidimicrobiia bacterium]|jgi:uncharacterized membrane protein
MYQVLLWLHIIGAAAWLGGNITQVVLGRSFAREPKPAVAAFLRGTVVMGTRQYTPAAVLILVTGILMVLQNDAWHFESGFVVIGILMVVVGGALGGAVFGPVGRKTAEAYDAGDLEKAVAGERRLAAFGTLDTALVLGTLAAMVWKWGA